MASGFIHSRKRNDALNRRHAPCADKLELRMDVLFQGVEVAAIERFVEPSQASDDLFVIHRPRSMSRSAVA
jgi:hypothetical protein